MDNLLTARLNAATSAKAGKALDWDDAYLLFRAQQSQEAAAYDALGGLGGGGEACANCNWFVSPNSCIMVSGDISPTGKSKHWAAVPEYEMEPMEVRIVKEGQGQTAPGPLESAKSIVRETLTSLGLLPLHTKSPMLKLRQHLLEHLGEKGLIDSRECHLSDGSTLIATKDSATGRPRLTFWVSNNFRDNDNPPEILTADAHQQFVAWADKEGHHPEAWLWHTPGTRWGEVDWVDYFDGFLVESVLADKGMEHVADALAADPDLTVSHGFVTLARSPSDWSHITSYMQFEISPLPAGKEANPLTGCANLDLTPLLARVTGKGNTNTAHGDGAEEYPQMAMNPEKRKWLVDKLGEEKVTGVEARTLDLSTIAKSLGLESKEVADALGIAELPIGIITIPIVPAEFRAIPDAQPDTAAAPAASLDIKALADEVASRFDLPGLQTFLKDLGTRLNTLEAGQSKAIGDAIRPPAGDAASLLWSSRPSASPNNIITKEASDALGSPRSDDDSLPLHMKEIQELMPAVFGHRNGKEPGPDAPLAR